MTIIAIHQVPNQHVRQFFRSIGVQRRWSFPVVFMTVVN